MQPIGALPIGRPARGARVPEAGDWNRCTPFGTLGKVLPMNLNAFRGTDESLTVSCQFLVLLLLLLFLHRCALGRAGPSNYLLYRKTAPLRACLLYTSPSPRDPR